MLECLFLTYEKYLNIKDLSQPNNLEKDSFNQVKNEIPEYEVSSVRREKEDLIDINLESFRLLSDILDIPFRKDSIEIALRDAYRNSDQPGIQLIGKQFSDNNLLSIAKSWHSATDFPEKYPPILAN